MATGNVEWLMRTAAFFLLLFCFLLGCRTQTAPKRAYTPRIRIAETNDFTGEPGIAYRFTEEQLAHMARTRLETNKFVSYVEKRWPIKRLQAYCVADNTRPPLWQNLVAQPCVETELFKGKTTGFDKVWVYVGEDDGRNTYFEETGTRWHRWTYSLNIERAGSQWVIIEQLPNDFMDSPNYVR
ncbi:MAG TPA: hypothetical protein VFZ59_10145 [Verrucomicrobiae bacterium]|nr:hypothetical protein [Verrucomicrobiae bacterium]